MHLSIPSPSLLDANGNGRPVELVFPCLDLCRVMVLHPHAAEMLATAQDLGPALVSAAAQRCAEAAGTSVQVRSSEQGDVDAFYGCGSSGLEDGFVWSFLVQSFTML